MSSKMSYCSELSLYRLSMVYVLSMEPILAFLYVIFFAEEQTLLLSSLKICFYPAVARLDNCLDYTLDSLSTPTYEAVLFLRKLPFFLEVISGLMCLTLFFIFSPLDDLVCESTSLPVVPMPFPLGFLV